jgi:hypothetical protein
LKISCYALVSCFCGLDAVATWHYFCVLKMGESPITLGPAGCSLPKCVSDGLNNRHSVLSCHRFYFQNAA